MMSPNNFLYYSLFGLSLFTPILFNRIGNLRALEDIYHLGYGIHATPLPASQTEFEAVPSTKPGPFLTQSPSRLGSFSAHDSTSQLVPQSDNSFNNEQLREQPSGPEAMYRIAEQLVAMDATERRALYQQRRQKMLSDKIDCAKFLTYFIENYPQSVYETRKGDSEFWKRFK